MARIFLMLVCVGNMDSELSEILYMEGVVLSRTIHNTC